MSKAKDVRFIVIDIDGVMTDNRLYYTETGMYTKSFNVKDGLAIVGIMQLGIGVGVITGGSEPLVLKRFEDLGITDFFLGRLSKLEALEEIRAKYDLKYEQMAYIGDDWIDIAPMKKVGYPIAVRDAAKEVKKVARYVTKAKGGKNAVREAIERISRKQFGASALANIWINRK